jgi:thiol-disulfide isomerase/thioredoxin
MPNSGTQADLPEGPEVEEVAGVTRLGIVAHLGFIAIGSLLVFVFAAALLPALRAQGEAPCRSLEPEPRSGPAPQFAVQDLAGQPVALADFAGKLVIVNFWATWCEPCIREWPQLDRLAERFVDRDDVVILAISMDSDPALIAPFLDRMSLDKTRVRVLWDPKQAVQKEFGTTQLPDTYFVDRAGQLVHAFINVRDWGRPAAYQCVESMLARR